MLQQFPGVRQSLETVARERIDTNRQRGQATEHVPSTSSSTRA